ncbi:protein ITPRID1 isoform X2 [Brienomyrus brachyistius]|uniref:protein ITPRID1 isoform X2 n=1 Tax=Brienomyrus brachyistius TaxID=42636 RepID=UPI0020B2DF20|nr:protein ITPRID1 isoform X2 [Brienomyrus brachyistius]
MTARHSKRANLVASKLQWSRICDHLEPSSRTGESQQDSIRQWLISGYQGDNQINLSVDPTESLRRHGSTEDDLVLGVEASLYRKQTPHRTAEQRHEPLHLSPSLLRGNSITSTVSALSGCRSVMDVLKLWHDDPEEFLLDLGFGSDEPDITVKIPARFINHPSQARGINIQVFLEAQKNRIDIENPDLSNRFRQLEVLHQVATAFSSLVGSPPGNQPPAQQPVAGQRHVNQPEASERRKRLAMLLRRASRKNLTQSTTDHIPHQDSSLEPRLESCPEPRPALKRSRQLLLPSEGSALSPLAEEQGTSSDPSQPKLSPTPSIQEAPLRIRLGRDAVSTPSTVLTRKRSPEDGREPESFELEEIQSFDDTSVAGNVTGHSNGTELGVVRTNSCQSDSSGFLEEPVIPPRSQQGAAAPDLMKTLRANAGDDTKIQGMQEGCQDASYRVPPVRANLEGDHSTEGLETSPGPRASWVDGTAKIELSREEEEHEKKAPTLMVNYTITSSYNEGNMGCVLEEGGMVISSEDSCRGEESNTGESMATLLMDSADSDELTYVSSVEDIPNLDQEVEPLGLQSFIEYTGSKEPSSGEVRGLLEAPPASSLPRLWHEQSNPTLVEDAGCGGGRPFCWVSVQMPSSLSSVSQTINGRATPPTPTPDSVLGRTWSDHELAPDFSLDSPSEHALDLPSDFPSPRPQHGTQRSEGGFCTRSTSLDTGLAYEEDDEEEEMSSGHWKVESGACCCRCHHRCSCCPPQALHRHCSHQHPDNSTLKMQRTSSMSSTFPYSMHELDEMMRSSRTFRLVLADIERRLGEEQASLRGDLMEEDREDIKVIQELRSAVRKEAVELEVQLADLAHHYDQGFRTKMHRLLDEQSYLCAQLRLRPPEVLLWNPATMPSPTPSTSPNPRLNSAPSIRTRTVATQCSLLPWPPLGGASTQEGIQVPQNTIDTPQSGSDQILGGKQNKLDFVTFLQSLKEPLRRSVTRDTLK